MRYNPYEISDRQKVENMYKFLFNYETLLTNNILHAENDLIKKHQHSIYDFMTLYDAEREKVFFDKIMFNLSVILRGGQGFYITNNNLLK